MTPPHPPCCLISLPSLLFPMLPPLHGVGTDGAKWLLLAHLRGLRGRMEVGAWLGAALHPFIYYRAVSLLRNCWRTLCTEVVPVLTWVVHFLVRLCSFILSLHSFQSWRSPLSPTQLPRAHPPCRPSPGSAASQTLGSQEGAASDPLSPLTPHSFTLRNSPVLQGGQEGLAGLHRVRGPGIQARCPMPPPPPAGFCT